MHLIGVLIIHPIFTPDGLHLAESGNAKVLFRIQETIKSQFPTICPIDSNNQPFLSMMHFPHWSVLNEKSFEDAVRILNSWEWTKL